MGTKNIALLIIAVAFVAATLTLAIPTPIDNSWLSFHTYLGLAFATTILYVGASALFAKALPNFTPTLQRAYFLICAGIVLLGIAQLQLPVLIWLGQVDGLWYETGLIALPYLAALVALFAGTRTFAHLFGVKNLTTRWWFLLLVFALCAFLLSLMPHAKPPIDETAFDSANAFTVLNVTFMWFVAGHVLQVKRVASASYANALAWLFIGFAISTFSGVGFIILLMIFGQQLWYVTALIVLLPSTIVGLCLVKAAYSFNATAKGGDTEQTWIVRNFFGTPHKAKPHHGAISSVDIVAYVSNLVSSPSEIDPLLDKVRILTAGVDRNKPLAAADEKMLETVYLQIETYLLEKEIARKFTKDSLRQNIANRLQLTAASNTFWNHLK